MEYANRLKELIEQVASDLDFELVDYDLFQAGNGKLLRIFIDKEGGVNIQDCSKLSRELGAVLDLEDILPFAYTLEVSSPGVDRPLKSVRDFQRQIGRLLKIQLSEVDPVLGRKILGQLKSADESGILLDLDDNELSLSYDRILSAKVEIQF